MDTTELCYMSAMQLASAIRSKEISPVEVVDAVLARIERLNPKLNAYCTVTATAAGVAAKEAEAAIMRGDALGILHGIPVSIKDLVATRGLRTTHGSRLYEQFIPDEDAPVVERLKRAGAILLGKTNTPEFGHKAITDNLVFGLSRNPWSLNHTPGGSSGGAAAAVAAALGQLAIGTDAGGSIRVPSSCCAVFGLKPTLGLVAMAPTYGGLETLSHTGPMTRTVRANAELHCRDGRTRSKLSAFYRGGFSLWSRSRHSRPTSGLESGLGLCCGGPRSASARGDSGATFYRVGLPCGGGASRIR
jgi:Asp-tRNA(Asn)/Glu-tRNA(Gln) amidotransferase A subunit family amidase